MIEMSKQNSTDVILVLARGMITEIDHPTAGRIKLVNTPIKFSESLPSIRTPPPLLGQHTEEVMLSLGYSQEQLDILRKRKIITLSRQ